VEIIMESVVEEKESLILEFLNRKMGIMLEALEDPTNDLITS
jgi:hypothetical protein